MTDIEGKSLDIIKTAVIQMKPVLGEKEGNIKKTIDFIDEAVNQDAKLIILPELCNTGYAFQSRSELSGAAEEIPSGLSCKAWINKAIEKKVYIVAGIAEKQCNKIYNSAVIIGPEGYIGTYRKAHLWYNEKLIFDPGDSGFPVFELPFGKLGIQICYDFWFVEGVRIMSLKGAEIIAVPTNWPAAQPENTWDSHGYCMGNHRAIAHSNFNKVYIACSNRVGIERGGEFAGCSIITDYCGWPLAGPASKDKEEILYAVLDMMAVRRSKMLNLDESLNDRRCDIYDQTLGYRI